MEPWLDALPGLAELVIAHEGVSATSYSDTKGNPTVGIGHHLDGSKRSHYHVRMADSSYRRIIKHRRPLTPKQMAVLFKYDLAEACRGAEVACPSIHWLPTGLQYTLVDMSFNLGLTRLLGFRRMLAALNVGNQADYGTVVTEMMDSKWYRDDVPVRARELVGIASGALKVENVIKRYRIDPEILYWVYGRSR